jgi:superfamily II DNA or RNA helicase
MTTSPSRLRDYQRRTVHEAVRVLKSGDARRVLVVAPTGSGKTVMAAALARCARKGGRKVLAVAHRREIRKQLQDRIPGSWAVTIQSPSDGWDHDPEALIIVDEAHHLPAGQAWFENLGPWKDNLCVGLTATPHRADHQGLGDVFDEMIVSTTYPDLIRDGHLVDARVISPKRIVDGSASNPVEAYLTHAKGRAGFAFFKRVSHAVDAAEAFNVAGIKAAAVHGAMHKKERARHIAAFRRGELDMLCNCNILTEGFDAPRASVVVLARERPYGHPSSYMQAVGRVLRPHPGKTEALVLDLDGNVMAHGLPTEHRHFSLDKGMTPRSRERGISVCQVCGHTFEAGPQMCPQCGEIRTVDGEPLKIYSRELLEVYNGKFTADAAKEREALRLIEICESRDWSVSWAAKKYAEQFGGDEIPGHIWTTQNKANELVRLNARRREKGYKPGYPAARYKSLFGHWPPSTERRREGMFWHD